jgi:hypothetical protein
MSIPRSDVRVSKTPRASSGPEARGQFLVYEAEDGRVKIDARLADETVWLSQRLMAELFQKDVRTINEHILNVYEEHELEPGATIRKFRIVQREGARNVARIVDHYNLDMIISVGYRVNSLRGTQFRIWATNVLRQHLVQGYTVHAQRLKELNQAVRLVADVAHRRTLSGDEATALLEVVADYAYALEVLDDYDHQRVRLGEVSPGPVAALDLSEARQVIARMGERFGASPLFGREKDEGLEGSLAAVVQTFGGQGVYPSLEEKAAHFLYFLVKDRPRRRQQTHRGGAVPLVPGEEPGALSRRRRQTHRRQRAGGDDAADRRKPAGREGRADAGGGEPHQPAQSLTGRA